MNTTPSDSFLVRLAGIAGLLAAMAWICGDILLLGNAIDRSLHPWLFDAQPGIVVAGPYPLALDPQLGKDALGIDQGLRATEADESHLGRGDFWTGERHALAGRGVGGAGL